MKQKLINVDRHQVINKNEDYLIYKDVLSGTITKVSINDKVEFPDEKVECYIDYKTGDLVYYPLSYEEKK